MVAYLRSYRASCNTVAAQTLFAEALGIFCFNYPRSFQREFLGRVGSRQKIPHDEPLAADMEAEFVRWLATLPGECIFLLKDSFLALQGYQRATGRGVGICVNRAFLIDDGTEEVYLRLVQIIYDALSVSGPSLNAFLQEYRHRLKVMLNKDAVLRRRAAAIQAYAERHKSGGKIVWVDMGAQFTLSLFCYAAVDLFSGTATSQDIAAFTCYPWLRTIFAGRYYSEDLEQLIALELRSTRVYESVISDRTSGALVGFAIGDALGAPIAGIERRAVPPAVRMPVSTFERNPNHPLLGHLKAGQVTANTQLLTASARSLFKNGGFGVESYANDLGRWYLQASAREQRWIGPVTKDALAKLVTEGDVGATGVKGTDSCGALYRLVPFGLYYRPFARGTSEDARLAIEAATILTHNSQMAVVASVFVCSLIGDLLNEVPPERAAQAALDEAQRRGGDSELIARITYACNEWRTLSISTARRRFGTGSPVWQTLPLALFILLRYQGSFEGGVLAAANSLREDGLAETKRLRGLDPVAQIVAAHGGNTDGIAALVGSFLGARLGLAAIPVKLAQAVEQQSSLRRLGRHLAWR